jgi:DNA-binding transcriptional LysR family regulator
MVGPTVTSEDEVERAIFNNDVDIAITLKPINLPMRECVPFMHEDLLLFVREDDPLAKRDEVSFSEIDGRTFLVYANIGFWWEVCRENLSRSEFIRQNDRVVFQELARTSDALMFATATAGIDDYMGRVTVPIDDDAAHASFYVVMPEDTDEDLKAAIRAAAVF